MHLKKIKYFCFRLFVLLAVLSLVSCGSSSSDSSGGINFTGQINGAIAPVSKFRNNPQSPLAGVAVESGGGMGFTDERGMYNFNGFDKNFLGGEVLITVTNTDGTSRDFTLSDIPSNVRSIASDFLVQPDGTIEIVDSTFSTDDLPTPVSDDGSGMESS